MKNIEKTELQLIDISQKIGSVAEKNSQYTHGLAIKLSKQNKLLGELTVTGLIEQIDQHTFEFNSAFGGAL